MADTKITQLTEDTNPTVNDILPVVDIDTLTTKKVTIANLLKYNTANGTPQLDGSGKISASQLPAYVDDVLEYANLAAFPVTGATGIIYVALDTNLTYRWTGSVYVEISQGVQLGETSTTAYRGDRGKLAYDHSTYFGDPHTLIQSTWYNVPASPLTPAQNTDSPRWFIKITGLNTNLTINAPTNNGNSTGFYDKFMMQMYIKDDGTSRTLTFNAIFRSTTEFTLPTTTIAGKWRRLVFNWNQDDSKWDLVGIINQA